MNNPNAEYRIKTDQYDVDFEAYNSFDEVYGAFSADGSAYTVDRRGTPRQWLNYLVNENFGSVVANDGAGFIFVGMPKFGATKYYSLTDYLIRTLNGKRMLRLCSRETGKSYDFFEESEDYRYTVEAGRVRYEGVIEGTKVTLEIFVPLEDPCECWRITLTADRAKEFDLTVGEDFALPKREAGRVESFCGRITAETEADLYEEVYRKLYASFALAEGVPSVEYYDEQDGKFRFARALLAKPVTATPEGAVELVTSGAVFLEDRAVLEPVVAKYSGETAYAEELARVTEARQAIRTANTCELPDKNLQHFLNTWLKNQVYMTVRYNRSDLMGYRDVMQDCWGNLLVEPAFSRQRFLDALEKMHADGRCPRQFERTGSKIDNNDFMDSPIWAAITLVDYLKETGDFSILEEKLGYMEGDVRDGVLDHILRAYDYLYHSRGKNGLILMRCGDWLDGLTGIYKFGEATTVWGTIATFYGQNLLRELFLHLGDTEKADLMAARSAEYREIVNRVGWDGNWFAYAFIDEEPIGSHKCHEGKIYLNPQTWAIFSGIADSADKVEKMYRSVHTYLSTMYGPLLNAPAYKKFGEKCGRIQKQVPGTFANSAIYLHAASFKVFADCAAGRFDEALDTMQRILPNHPDSCDGRRTSEPYCVGNVYYGPEHPCFGLNLYTWFTATPAWLIHDGFEGLLGVKAEFDGLRISPRAFDGWDGYSVNKCYRDTVYHIRFLRGENKGITLDGAPVSGNLIKCDRPECEVVVTY